MMRAALHNLGCKVNAYETQKLAALLSLNGYEIVPFSEEADVYVINTCSVTAVADQKSRQMIRRARRCNPEAIVVAAGCYVQKEGLAPEALDCDIILGNDEKGNILSAISEYKEKGFKNGNGWLILIALSIGTMFLSQFIMQKAQKTQLQLSSVDGANGQAK